MGTSYRDRQQAGHLLFTQATKSGDLATLDRAIALFREAALRWPARDRQRALVLENLGGSLRTRYEFAGESTDLDEAIDWLRRAATRIPARRKARCLSELGVALRLRGRDEDVDESVRTHREAVATADDGERPGFQERLANALSTRAKRTGSAVDFEESVTLHRKAARDPGTAALALSNLGEMFLARFWRSGTMADLDQSIQAHQGAVQATADLRDRRRRQAELAYVLMSRFNENGDTADLDEAERSIRAALHGTKIGDSGYAAAKAGLGSTLTQRYVRFGGDEVIDEAVEALEEAVAGLDPSDADAVGVRANLVSALTFRLRHQGATRGFDRAVELLRTTIRDTPVGHDQKGFGLATLGQALQIRAEHSGSLTDANDAISTLRDAVDAFPRGHVHQAHARCELADALDHRFASTGSTADLEEALHHLEAALADLPERHPARPVALSGLSGVLRRMNRLDEALDTARRTLQLVPEDDPRRMNVLYDFGLVWLTKARETEDPADLDTAIEALRAAATALADSDARRSRGLSGLGVALAMRAELVDSPRDRDEAITVLRAAAGSPDQDAAALMVLGHSLHARFQRTGDDGDLTAALGSWRQAAGLTTASASARISAALDWAHAATDAGQSDSVVPAWSAVVELLPLLAWHGLDRGDQERLLAERFGVTSFGAAAVLEAAHPERALELLEHGRGVLWAQSLDLRADLGRVRETAPAAAERMEHIRTELDRATSDLAPVPLDEERSAARRDLRARLAKEWDDLVAEIRRRPGQADFLRPPRFADLRGLVPDGTAVVVNVSSLRCDAFCLDREGLRVVPLPDLSLADAVGYGNQLVRDVHTNDFAALQRTLAEILGWLWRTTARPVLDLLGYAPRERPADRVWWCPTGPLSVLPLHAAGESAEGDSVFARVISSYTPTLRVLASPPPSTTQGRLLVVSLPETPGHLPLPAVAEEAKALTDRLGAMATTVEGPQATHAAVSAILPDYPVVHFACHGRQDPVAPSTGALLLHDLPLSVLDIARMRLAHGELAFLSACETAFGGVRLVDESIHLAASLRLAGYRNVIGTLWPIVDKPAAAVAQDVYTHLFRDGSLDTRLTAEALHQAVVRLRDAEPGTPSLWAAYIHLG